MIHAKSRISNTELLFPILYIRIIIFFIHIDSLIVKEFPVTAIIVEFGSELVIWNALHLNHYIKPDLC